MEDSQNKSLSFRATLLQGIDTSTSLRPVSLRPIDEDTTQNKNFILTTQDNTYFTKVYTSGSIEEREFELDVLRKLQSNGVSFVPNPLIFQPLLIDNRPVVIFDTIEGSTLNYSYPTSTLLTTLASQLATMHNNLRGFNPGKKERFNALGFEFIDAFMLPTGDPIIHRGLAMLQAAYKAVDISKLEQTIIHDDLSPSNIIATPQGDLTFIDFDDAHYSYRVSDIGTVIKEFIIQPMGSIDMNAINLFISAYEGMKGTTPLSEVEKSLLIPMALRRALFMYAYYSMAKSQKSLSLQSSNEYSTVAVILKVS